MNISDLPVTLARRLLIKNAVDFSLSSYVFIYVEEGSVQLTPGRADQAVLPSADRSGTGLPGTDLPEMDPHDTGLHDADRSAAGPSQEPGSAEALQRQEAGAILLLSPGEHLHIRAEGQSALWLLGIAPDFMEETLAASTLAFVRLNMGEAHQDWLRLKSLVLETAQLSASVLPITVERQDGKQQFPLQMPAADQSGLALFHIMGNIYLILQEISALQQTYVQKEAANVPNLTGLGPQQRIYAMADYIRLHYADNLSLSSLAEAFYLTPSYLSAFFKKNFHMNFKEYLTRLRLRRSLPDLGRTDMTILEVAQKNGFASVSAYRKNFGDQYHMSPSAWRARNQHRNMTTSDNVWDGTLFDRDGTLFHRNITLTQDTGQIHAAAGLNEELEQKEPVVFPVTASSLANSSIEREQNLPASGSIRQSAYADAANIRDVLDPNSVGIHQHVATDQILNIGSVQNLLSERFRRQLLSFTSQYHFTYIRIMELVSSAFIPMVLPSRQFYYKNADQILSFLYDAGFIPMVELSRQQFDFRFSLDGTMEDSYYVWRTDRWYTLLADFASHVARRWPQNWLSMWKFEVTIRPREKPEAYLSDFERIHEILSESIPDVCLGGPGYQPAIATFSAEEFLKICRKKQAHLSFFSASLGYYRKLRAPGGKVESSASSRQEQTVITASTILSPDPDYLQKTCRQLRHAVKQSDAQLPFYVTEFQSATIQGLPIAYTCYQAAFLVKALSELSELADLCGYWLFCDARRVVPASSAHRRPAGNGDGLYTSDYLPTAAGYAYTFWRKLCAGTSPAGSGRIYPGFPPAGEETPLPGLKPQLLVRGKNYLCTCHGQDHFMLLAYHYTHLKDAGTGQAQLHAHVPSYDATLPSGPLQQTQVDFDQIYSIFEEEKAVHFYFHIDHARPGVYHIQRSLIHGMQGSPLDLLIAEYQHSRIDKTAFLQQIREMSHEENYSIVQNSAPEYRSIYTSPDHNRITVEVLLPSHTVCFWDIQRQL